MEPLTLIKSLQGAQQSYAEASSLLESAFASPLLQKYDIINRLSQLKLRPNGEIYAFISEMRIIISTFTKLKIDVNTILQCYIWQAMPEGLRMRLAQIESKIFEAAERYRDLPNSFHTTGKVSSMSREQTSGFAAAVSYDTSRVSKPQFRQCSLCSEQSSDHPLF